MQWRLFTKTRGGKGAEFAKLFIGNACTRQILGNIYRLHVLFMRKDLEENRENRGSRKIVIFFKTSYICLWLHNVRFTTLASLLCFSFPFFAENLPTRRHLGGAVYPPNSRYCLRRLLCISRGR